MSTDQKPRPFPKSYVSRRLVLAAGGAALAGAAMSVNPPAAPANQGGNGKGKGKKANVAPGRPIPYSSAPNSKNPQFNAVGAAWPSNASKNKIPPAVSGLGI